ncbi:ATP-binding protein [Sinorhizobium meliloti]|uniref:ATP-binding protein n=1 Tax=Rhizobium meliloti TaxID=382 RepID=UPI000FDB0FB8|nr:ATP-binding protein [Sinorhizobium meliloti]RVK42993.1 ATP-binding protein [Sinorhizobium meliloti]
MHEKFDQSAAVARVRATLESSQLATADRISEINSRYIGLSRDKVVADALAAMVSSIATVDTAAISKPDKRRIVAICGDSGAGKTRALIEHTSRIPAMQPYVDEDGIEVRPFLSYNAPSPCTPRLLAFAGLEALGYPIKKTLQEHQAWALFQDMLKVHRIMFVMIDESQHAVDTADVLMTTKIGNAFKNLVQMPDWPVRLILAGVAPLPSFLARKQLYNRRTVIRFDKIKGNAVKETIPTVLQQVVVAHAKLNLGDGLAGDFPKRLAHACDGDFGSIVQMVRGAVELAILDNSQVVDLKHFVRVYASYSGCMPGENMFKTDRWAEMVPYTAFMREEDHAWEKAHFEAKKRKPTKFGVRP